MTGTMDRRIPTRSQAKKAYGIPFFLRLILLTLAVIVITFLLGEVIERTWLSDLDMSLIHMFHTVRSIVSSLLVAVLVSWSLLRASPPLLLKPPSDREESGEDLITGEEKLLHYARWFIQMRWIAVMASGTLVFLGVKVTGLLLEESWWPLLFTAAALACFNLVYAAILTRKKSIPFLLPIQAYVDVVILTVLLHFSGGVENPLSLLMLIHVVIGGVLLSRAQCYALAGVTTALFAALAWGECLLVFHHYTLLIFPHGGEVHTAHQPLYVVSRILLQGVMLFLVAYFVTTLAERLRFDEHRLGSLADRALAERHLLEQALETTGTGLRVIDRDLKARWMNAKWKQWFAGSLHILQGYRDLPSWPEAPASPAPARETLEDGESRITEVKKIHPTLKEGSGKRNAQVIQVTTAPLRDRSGRISEVVQLAQDITCQKEIQAQMIWAGKMAAVGKLAGHVAHEVNNPNAIINAKARLLLSRHRPEMSEKVAGEISKIVDLSDRVAWIAQSLLSYCRPSVSRGEGVDLRVPIRKVLGMVREQAQSGGVVLEDRLDGENPRVRANENELEQVFLNLFINALDAMPGGGRLVLSGRVEPGAPAEHQAYLAVAVEDTGVGIPEEDLESIFEPFFTTKEEARGTGLGLSICRGLVRNHGGDILVESSLGHGSRFIVRLPIKEAWSREDGDGISFAHPDRG